MSDRYTQGVADGIRQAAAWLRQRADRYPEDIFPPPPAYGSGKVGVPDQYSAAMARHICLAWSTLMEKELAENPGEDPRDLALQIALLALEHCRHRPHEHNPPPSFGVTDCDIINRGINAIRLALAEDE